MPAHVPTQMSHPRADVAVTTGPTVIGPGMAVLPPLPRMLFWIGYVTEQALVVNVTGFGLVLISGCGHPRIEQILGVSATAPCELEKNCGSPPRRRAEPSPARRRTRPRVYRPTRELPGGRSGQVAPREHDAAAYDQGERDGEDGQRADCPEPVLQGLVAEQQVER